MASTTLRDYLRHTEDAISAGRLNDAMANCQRVLSHFPESLEAQRLLGPVAAHLAHQLPVVGVLPDRVDAGAERDLDPVAVGLRARDG